MAAARADHAPQVALDPAPPIYDVPPAIGRDSPRPRAAQWRAARPPRPPAPRWLKVGSCVLLFGLLALTLLSEPISAGLERLMRPWLEWQDPWQPPATPQAEPAPPALPAPAVGREEPPPALPPLLAREELAAASPPRPAAPVERITAAVPDQDLPARPGVPLPSFKPPVEDQ